MRTRAWRLRAGALLLAAAFALHQLRFLLAYHGGASHELGRQGHDYLALLLPLVPAALVLGALSLASALSAAGRGTAAECSPPRTRTLWAGASATLLVLYTAQESVEGVAASGHPAGLSGLVGHGGWIAVPLALALGLLVALLLRGAAAAVARVSARARGRAPRRPARSLPRPPRAWRPRLGLLARHLAGRGPPPTLA